MADYSQYSVEELLKMRDDRQAKLSSMSTGELIERRGMLKSGKKPTGGYEEGIGAQPDSEIRPYEPMTRREVGEGLRPYLKGTGMVLGSIAGGFVGGAGGALASAPVGGSIAPVMVPSGAFAGRGIGAGIGNAFGDWLADKIVGDANLSDLVTDTVPKRASMKDSFVEGVTGNIIGEGVGAGLGLAAKGGTKLYRGVKNAFTTEGAELAAGQKYTNAFGSPTTAELASQAKTEGLEKRIGIGPLTPAQRTGSTKAGMVEQSLGAGDKEFADQMVRREAEMKDKAQNRFLDTMGKGKDLPKTQPPSVTGEAIHTGIEKDLAPVKTAEKAVWGQVPQYPIPSVNLDKAVSQIKTTPYEKPVQDAVDATINYIKEVPRTTEGIRSIEKTLTGNISKALRNGDNNLARVYSDMKAAVKADYEAMGSAAESGDVALYQGNIVYPSQISISIGDLETRIATESAKKSIPDINAIESALKQKGIPTIQIRGETNEGYANRLVQDYQKSIGKDIPTSPSANAELIKNLTEKKAKLEHVAANLEPAEDVASAISQAKKFSKEEKFDRFFRGQTKKVLKPGDEFEGQQLPFEQIPKKFYTPSGYKDLVRASGSNAKASQRMQPFVIDDLVTSSTTNGEFSVPKALNYLRKNQEVLKASGLDAEVKEIIKGQMPGEFERMLSTKRLDKVTGEPFFTLQESRTILSKYGKTLKELYGPQSVAALRDYQDLVFALTRNKNISMAGGSNTVEKALNSPADLPPLAQRVLSAVGREWVTGLGGIMGIGEAVSSGGGSGSVAIGAMAGMYAGRSVKIIYDKVVEEAQRKTMELFKKALIDPSLAKKLMDMVKTKQPESLAQQAAALVKPYLGPIGIAATTEEKEPEPTPGPVKRKSYGEPGDE